MGVWLGWLADYTGAQPCVRGATKATHALETRWPEALGEALKIPSRKPSGPPGMPPTSTYFNLRAKHLTLAPPYHADIELPELESIGDEGVVVRRSSGAALVAWLARSGFGQFTEDWAGLGLAACLLLRYYDDGPSYDDARGGDPRSLVRHKNPHPITHTSPRIPSTRRGRTTV
ncbi:hypothetical protein V499_01772 [Pseudogymnoascus sp. VKM F-103]|nr:hypothetical protein V499_01772 [Pseudogymnoascus sp. VKM F-103]